MSALNPGKVTELTEKLRALMKESERNRTTRVREADAPKLEADDTNVPKAPTLDEAGDPVFSAEYPGPITPGYGGGSGPRIGAIYADE